MAVARFFVLTVVLGGCTGLISDPGASGGGGGPAGRAPGASEEPAPPVFGGTSCEGGTAARLWRLTHAQYDNTVRDLLGLDARAQASFEPQSSGTGFRGGADTGYVSETLAEQYLIAAERLAGEAVLDLDALLPCSPADPDDRACVAAFVDDFGHRAFRKPLTDEQRAIYMGLYDEGAASGGAVAIEMALAAMLISPHFLYRFELGATPDGERSPLTQHELATALSFFLWDTTPDAELLGAAADGRLADADVLRAQIERMLDDPRSDRVFVDFFDDYLGLFEVPLLAKDEALFPDFTPELAASMHRESQAFVAHVARLPEGSLGELFTADYTFADEALAAFYGVSGPSGSELERVSLPPDERSGLLTHAGLLARLGSTRSGSPTFRGLLVRSRLLCQEIPEPPADVADSLPEPDEVVTTRDRYREHAERDACSGCHQLIDPIGFGLEHYDAIGAYRTHENGAAVDASGTIVGTRDADGDFYGARELAERLAASEEVSDCVATQFFRFAHGRLESDADACEVERLRTRFRESGGGLVSLVTTVIDGSAFRYRTRGEER